MTDDGQYLLTHLSKGTDEKVPNPLSGPRGAGAGGPKPIQLVDKFDHEYTLIDNDGPVLWFKTTRTRRVEG